MRHQLRRVFTIENIIAVFVWALSVSLVIYFKLF
jgi:hypothetical protein